MLFPAGRFCLMAASALLVLVSLMPQASAADEQASASTTAAEVADHGGDSHDADHGHGDHPPLLSIDLGSAVINLAIFLGVFAVLAKFVWPVASAEKANADAKSLLTEYQAKLDEAANQVQEMLASARKDAEAAGQRIVDEAKSEAERQRERAVSDIETAKKVAISELAGQTSDMAIQVAKQVVGRELKAEDHAELIRQSLERLPSNN